MTAAADKSDQELAADARMIVAALGRIRTEARRRGIDIDLLVWDEGKVEVTIERVTREKL
jgi:7,8-dihydro-6-hydroxymethylpterin-pyrophosphokinase